MRRARSLPLATLVALTVTSSFALTACAGVGGGSDQPATGGGTGSGSGSGANTPSGALQIMGFSGGDEVASSRMAAFRAAYPDVDVTANKGDFDAQQFLTAVSSGNAPDVVYMDRKLIGTYAAQGAIEPMDTCIEDQHIDTSQYRQAAMKQVTIGDKVYGIPEFYTVSVNLINEKALRAAGLTDADIQTKDWGALKATARRLFKSNGSELQRIGYDTHIPDAFPLWARANGVEIVNQDGSPNLNDPKAVEALQFNVDMVRMQGGWSDYKAFRDSFDLFGEENQFTKDQLVAFPIENWYVNVLLSSRKNGLELGSTMFTDKQGQPISILGGNAWAIPKGAKNPTAACAFAKTMTDKETWMKAAAARIATVKKDKSFFTGLFTASKPADEAIKAKYLKPTGDKGFDAAIENYYKTLDIAEPLPSSPVGAQIDNAWAAAVERALTGKMGAEDALDRAQQEAQAAFDKAPKNG
jgi:multiple sugar transport system substrate-binding protein